MKNEHFLDNYRHFGASVLGLLNAGSFFTWPNCDGSCANARPGPLTIFFKGNMGQPEKGGF